MRDKIVTAFFLAMLLVVVFVNMCSGPLEHTSAEKIVIPTCEVEYDIETDSHVVSGDSEMIISLDQIAWVESASFGCRIWLRSGFCRNTHLEIGYFKSLLATE